MAVNGRASFKAISEIADALWTCRRVGTWDFDDVLSTELAHITTAFDGPDRGLRIRRGLAAQRFDSS